jgi:hypothetical protein
MGQTTSELTHGIFHRTALVESRPCFKKTEKMHSYLVDCAAHKVAAAAALRYSGRLDALPDGVLDVSQYLPNGGILCLRVCRLDG